MAKVTGIGGVFIKSTKDKQALADWYRDNLGLNFEDWGGSIINWTDDSQVDGPRCHFGDLQSWPGGAHSRAHGLSHVGGEILAIDEEVRPAARSVAQVKSKPA